MQDDLAAFFFGSFWIKFSAHLCSGPVRTDLTYDSST